MGFFARLKWLLTGEGESPASVKKSVPHTRPDSFQGGRPSGQHRDRHDRGGRDRNFNRDDRDQQRGGRYGAEQSRDRNHDRNDRGGRGGRGRDQERYPDRDRGSQGRRPNGPQGGGYGRRDSASTDSSFTRIERPTGGPSSTMRPAQSSAELPAVSPVREPQQGPEKVGVVTQYFDNAKVAAVKIEKGSMRAGDWIEIQGSISALRQKVDSMQIDSQPVAEAQEGQEVGIRVIRPVKAGDAVVRLRG